MNDFDLDHAVAGGGPFVLPADAWDLDQYPDNGNAIVLTMRARNDAHVSTVVTNEFLDDLRGILDNRAVDVPGSNRASYSLSRVGGDLYVTVTDTNTQVTVEGVVHNDFLDCLQEMIDFRRSTRLVKITALLAGAMPCGRTQLGHDNILTPRWLRSARHRSPQGWLGTTWRDLPRSALR